VPLSDRCNGDLLRVGSLPREMEPGTCMRVWIGVQVPESDTHTHTHKIPIPETRVDIWYLCYSLISTTTLWCSVQPNVWNMLDEQLATALQQIFEVLYPNVKYCVTPTGSVFSVVSA